jgi:hypothetical protein
VAKVRIELRHVRLSMVQPNAASEWQARSLGWRSRDLEVACPLERCVRSDAAGDILPKP